MFVSLVWEQNMALKQPRVCWNNEKKFNFNFKANNFKTSLPYIVEIKVALTAWKG